MKTIALAIAWMLIAVPLGWGVYQSVQKSMPLFEGQSEPAVPSRQASQSCCCFGRSGNFGGWISGERERFGLYDFVT
jgi:hypothetical protein